MSQPAHSETGNAWFQLGAAAVVEISYLQEMRRAKVLRMLDGEANDARYELSPWREVTYINSAYEEGFDTSWKETITHPRHQIFARQKAKQPLPDEFNAFLSQRIASGRPLRLSGDAVDAAVPGLEPSAPECLLLLYAVAEEARRP